VEHRNRCWFKTCWILALITLTNPTQAKNLEALIATAIKSDPWLAQSQAQERAARAEAVAGGELPDPRFTASFANLPTDTFDFSQEPMTQVMVGLSQSFPGGDTRQLRRQRLGQMGDVSVIERSMRVAQLRRDITLLWADASLADKTARLINKDRALFEQLETVIQSSYSSAGKGTSQQDLIRAELEITRLDERVLQLKERRQRKIEQLTQWVPQSMVYAVAEFQLPNESPDSNKQVSLHPETQVHDQRIEIARTGYELAKETLRPGFTLNTSYGYRDEDRNGRDLPDFVSVGVSMALPFFRAKRQDKQVAAAAERVAAEEAARLLTIRRLQAMQSDAHARLIQLDQQTALYENTLLRQMTALTDAALSAYASNQTDFSEVMRAHIAQLNAQIEALRLETERQKTIAQLQYLGTTINDSTVSRATDTGVTS
jgi:outer membrane protein TolC